MATQAFARAYGFGGSSTILETPPVFDDKSALKPAGGGGAEESGLNLFSFPFKPMSPHLAVDPGYRALHEQAGWFDLSARGRIRLTGEDRARLLHAMTTQQVEQMKPGDGCYAFFLNAQGRILADVHIFCFEDYFLLDTEPETRQKIYDHIDRYIIADDATLEDVTGSLTAIAIEGPAAETILKSIAAPVPPVEHATLAWGDRTVARISATGAGGFRVFLPSPAKKEFIASLRIPQANTQDVRLVRIEHGQPRYGEEITERYLVQETAQLHAVNFNKGCYLGQEIVERVRSRAQIHRILRALLIESTDAPEVGAKLHAAETEVGEVVSAAFSPALAKVVAMAYLKIAAAEPGTKLSLNGAVASVT